MEEQYNNSKNSMPLVSVGMPIYNVGSFIERSLLSVLDQTYDNIEILAVDDCGSDNSMDIVKHLQIEHPRGSAIRIIRHSENKGLGEARNTAIDHASGKYLYFIDSDDYIEPETLSIMVPEAEKHHADVVHTVARTVYDKTCRVEHSFPEQPYRVLKGKDAFADFVCQDHRRHVSFTSWNILFSIEFIRKNNLHFYPITCEDILFFYDYYPLVEVAVLMPNVTYNYLKREGSIMDSAKGGRIPVKSIKKWFEANSIMLEHSFQYVDRPFYCVHCARMLKQDFRAVCIALRHRKRFDGKLTDEEICQNLRHPSSYAQILKFKRYRVVNLFFKILGSLPVWMCVRLSYIIGKAIRWI